MRHVRPPRRPLTRVVKSGFLRHVVGLRRRRQRVQETCRIFPVFVTRREIDGLIRLSAPAISGLERAFCVALGLIFHFLENGKYA